MKETSLTSYTANYLFLSSIEGSVFSNYYYVTESLVTRSYIKNISRKYFEHELIFFQMSLLGYYFLFQNSRKS